MNGDLLYFFEKMPAALYLYEAIEQKIMAELANVHMKVQKTQITFYNKHNFACVSLPYRRIKGRPDVYVILTFGLMHRIDDARIAQAVEPYPNRWTHHVIVQSPLEVDRQLMAWVREAYDLSLSK